LALWRLKAYINKDTVLIANIIVRTLWIIIIIIKSNKEVKVKIVIYQQMLYLLHLERFNL
jgi:hypothetical protein